MHSLISLLLIFGLGTTELIIAFVAIGGVVATIVFSANKKPLNANSMDGQVNQIQQNPYQGNQQTVVAFGNQKSMLAAFLLAFFFGPLGLLYSSVTGGIVLILVGIPVGIFTLGFGLIFVWIASIIWAIIATRGSNSEMQSGARVNINTIYAPPVVNLSSYSEPVYQSHQNEPVYTTSQYQQSQTTPNPVFQQTVVSFGNQKSVLVAFLLAFFFGPLGLLYSSITGGVILMIIGIPIGIVTLGFGLIFIWIASVIWAIIATNSVNNKMQSGGALNINTQYRSPAINRQPVSQPNYTTNDDSPIINQPRTTPQSKAPPIPQTPPQPPQTSHQQQIEPQPQIESKPQYPPRPQLDQYRQSPTQTQRQLVPAPPRYLQQLSEPISTGNIFKRFMIGIASILLILILVVGIKFIWGMDFSKLNFNPLKIFTKEADKNDGTLDKTDITFSDASSIINSGNDFYMVNVEAVKSQSEAENKVSFLKNDGYSAGYLWIPNYSSLSGMQSYAVYIGPFSTQYDCEVATEEYREKNPDAYGLLVSKERRRVEIYGIGNVKVIPNWRSSELANSSSNSQTKKVPTEIESTSIQSDTDAQRILSGIWYGTIGKKKFILNLETVGGGRVSGYNIAGSNQRPVKGTYTFSQGNSICKLILQEPGSDKWDGSFTIDMDVISDDWGASGIWKAYKGQLSNPVLFSRRPPDNPNDYIVHSNSSDPTAKFIGIWTNPNRDELKILLSGINFKVSYFPYQDYIFDFEGYFRNGVIKCPLGQDDKDTIVISFIGTKKLKFEGPGFETNYFTK